MRDCNGRELKVGDQFFCYRYGLCSVITDDSYLGKIQVWAERVCQFHHYAYVSNSSSIGRRMIGFNEHDFHEELPDAFKVRTWKEMAKEALAVQDACNLVAVVASFHTIVKEVKARLESEGKGGTEAVWQHPICILFSSKIASLTASESPTIFSRAYEWSKNQT